MENDADLWYDSGRRQPGRAVMAKVEWEQMVARQTCNDADYLAIIK